MTKLPHVSSEWTNLIWKADIIVELSYIYSGLVVTQGTMRAVLCLLLITIVVQLSTQQSIMKSFRGLARRRAGQAYRLFRKIRDPVKYKLQYAPTNLKRLLHGYYPKKPKVRGGTKVYHVHHHHYPKKEPLIVIPKNLLKLPKLPPLPSLPKPKLPKIKIPKIKLPKEIGQNIC